MKSNCLPGLIAILLVFCPVGVRGQLVINEFSASNVNVIDDPDFGDDADWIELYNAGNQPVDLYHFYLTDNLSNPDKWQVPVHVNIAAGAFLLIWTDSRDTLLHTSFGLSKDGEQIGLYTPDGTLEDSLSFGLQMTNISYGRQHDGDPVWGFFTEPTPGSSNTTTAYPGFVEAVPDFSILGGVFSGPLSLELSSVLGGTIRYTTDGSRPTENSPAYTAPLNISSTTVLRARVFLPGLIPGTVITHSYMMDENYSLRDLPLVSIATEPENFWDPQTGIYVQDFKPDWEVPVNIELFENNGSDRAAFNLPAGIKVNGLYSWQLPQKMLGVYFRKQYGEGSLSYPLFFEKSRTDFEDFALRASGSDWSYTLFRDMLGHDAIQRYMDLDIMAFRPSIVYVNGQYMGIHNIREKVDNGYIVGNYGLAPGTFDLIENEDFAEEGDLDAYNEFLTVLERDLSVQSNYDAVAELMDIENFTNLAVSEVALANTSISHNVMCWKPKEGGKWRWVVMDLDRGFFSTDGYLINYYTGQGVLPLKELLENDGYRAYFGKKLADHLFVTFHPLQMNRLIDKHMADIEAEMPYHIDRWQGTTSSYGDAIPSMSYWYEEVDQLRAFVEARPSVVLDDLTGYGFDQSVLLSLFVSPHDGGMIYFNGLKIPDSRWSGLYPDGLEIALEAVDRPGYVFRGWKELNPQTVVAAGSNWRYLDNGSDQGTAWKEEGFSDASWKSGYAELGYGDGDEATVVSFGGNSSNKFITTYFRKTFELTSADLDALSFLINLVRDDGAVIYVNGTEVARSNMPGGAIGYRTEALSSVGGSEESAWNQYSIEKSLLHAGTNTLAVEIHQSGPTSSDFSFNLELLALGSSSAGYLSTDADWTFTLNGATSLLADYEPSGACIIPDTIETDFTLDAACSPWMAQGDVVVLPGATLTVEAGVEVQMPSEASVYTFGRMLVNGTEEKPVLFTLNPQYRENWGALFFQESPDTSLLTWVRIEKASHGPGQFNAVAAVSAFKARLRIDHADITDIGRNPVAARYSDIVMTNSSLHSDITGDLINVKYGTARVENCIFIGNDKPDTDAIDYDDVVNGIIRNCTIRDLKGFNSDAIDIGERAENILIEGNVIYNITDKGVSVGQKSTAKVINNLFISCNLGLGLKDSCHVLVDHCTFYNVGTPVACFEKNAGSAGGNATVINSILSNSVQASWSSDRRSTISLSYNLSDNDMLPGDEGNLFDDPRFAAPSRFNFSLADNSPCIGAGLENGETVDLGASLSPFAFDPPVMISHIFYNPLSDKDKSEFITIFNPAPDEVDLSGYTLSEAFSFTIPEGTVLGSGKNLYLARDLSSPSHYAYPAPVFQWTSGGLANEGEAIILTDRYGIVQDKVAYSPDEPWPVLTEAGDVLSLSDTDLDNHFGKNWSITDYNHLINTGLNPADSSLLIYPNPASSEFYLRCDLPAGSQLTLFDLSGKAVWKGVTEDGGLTRIQVGGLRNGFYLLRAGELTGKVVISVK
ncbi:MAG: lamin tail domain-containing protein [Bacteroidota bacterium]